MIMNGMKSIASADRAARANARRKNRETDFDQEEPANKKAKIEEDAVMTQEERARIQKEHDEAVKHFKLKMERLEMELELVSSERRRLNKTLEEQGRDQSGKYTQPTFYLDKRSAPALVEASDEEYNRMLDYALDSELLVDDDTAEALIDETGWSFTDKGLLEHQTQWLKKHLLE
ncbi:hypothetical protein D6C93_04095 [Aureobasidium pullulans]|uniref:Uncharacterized protein n=1 Tax=Aureobasidium pullulans TaxID=5580 RepID=A0A4S9RLF6_AURPU|nr:hypothetical protein D6D22_03148 [Aureobasidium pullulans]THY98866.1 hypothetical protein D6C93_04095 [Aureobasidium pullulans]